MPNSLDPQAPIEDLMAQFRMVAAEVQSAYHQLEQELLMEGKEDWEPEPATTGLALPNLAPLHLMGTLVGGLSKASLVINQTLEVISANGEAQKDFNLGESTSLRAVLAPASAKLLQQLIDDAASRSAVDIRLKNGSSAGIFDSIYLDNPIEKGRLLLLVAQDLELDHLREVEDQILKNLTGTLVHEIRTPLTSMQGFAELLLQVQDSDSQETDKLNMIRQGIERLNLLASTLGTVFHEIVEPHWIKVDLYPFLVNLVEKFLVNRSLAEDIIGPVDRQEEVQVVTDPELLRLALERILDNAVEALHRPSPGQVQIKLFRTGTEATIGICDRGIGLGKSDGSNWWAPFYTTKSGHLGLGLVEVRRIIGVLGGQADIKAGKEGGVEVGLTLPI